VILRPDLVRGLPSPGAGSQVTIDMDFEGHGIGKFFIPSIARFAARRQLPKNLQNLKRVLEQSR
jgi:hypothetical protein